jgi:hypothetical protein
VILRKPGTKLTGMQAPLLFGLLLAEQAFASVGQDLIITSLNDGQHKTGSFHYRGLAADLRIKHVPEGKRPVVLARLGDALGPEWDVLWEGRGTPNEHLHIEYDPKP